LTTATVSLPQSESTKFDYAETSPLARKRKVGRKGKRRWEASPKADKPPIVLQGVV